MLKNVEQKQQSYNQFSPPPLEEGNSLGKNIEQNCLLVIY